MYIYCLLIPIARFIFPPKKNWLFATSIIFSRRASFRISKNSRNGQSTTYLLTIFHLADELTHKLPDFLFGNLLYTT